MPPLTVKINLRNAKNNKQNFLFYFVKLNKVDVILIIYLQIKNYYLQMFVEDYFEIVRIYIKIKTYAY